MMRKIFKPFDFLFFAISLLAIAFSMRTLKNGGKKEARLVISAAGSEYIFPLGKEKMLEIDGKIGTAKIKIENGEAFFIESPCLNQICVEMPHIKNKNDWAACIPNEIFIRIEK